MEGTSEPSSGPNRQRLEIPAVTQLERRLLVSPPATKPTIAPIPKSSVLGRLREFLPQMEEANKKLEDELQHQPAQAFDIEAVDEDAEGPVIEMDLACGVIDLKDDAALRAAEAAVASGGAAFEMYDGGSGSSSDGEDSADESDDKLAGAGADEEALAGSSRQAAAGAADGGAGGAAGVSDDMDTEAGQQQGQGQQGRRRKLHAGKKQLVTELS